MNIYYEPVNTLQWNIFEKVHGTGYTEPFLATKSMNIGDIVLFHVGQQDKRYESGIYAVGKVIKGPYILRNDPQDYCNNKNSVDVEIIKINFFKPLISHYDCTSFITQFRTVHLIDEIYYESILKELEM